MTRQRNLSHLSRGQTATIQGISAPGTLRLRLQELGFTPGADVQLVARSAFGGALAFRLRGSMVALRRADSSCVEI